MPEPHLHLPFPLRPLAVGVRPVAEERWLEPADASLLALRAQTFDARPEAVAAEPGSEPAQAELRAMVGAETRPGRPDVEAAARSVGEDLCLLDGPGHRLVAGAVAAPNRWRLADKLGHPLLDVHDPVPGYAAALGGPVDRLLDGLRPGRVLERRNWAVLDDPSLFQPDPGAGLPPGPVDADRLWLRVERQTVRRLPRTGAVCFTIRTRQWTLRELADHPGQAAGLAEALRATPDDLAAYKGVVAVRDELLAWLATVAP